VISTEPLFREPAAEASLERDGFVVLPLIGPEELDELRAFYADLHAGGPPPQSRDGIHMTIWCSDRPYKERVRDGLARILSPAVSRCFADLRIVSPVFVVKAPGGSNVFPIHQDWSVVDETRHRALNLWVPLFDEDASSGSLWVVPGTHRAGSPIRGAGYLFPNLRSIEATLRPHRVSPRCPAGSALVFYHRLVHGSPDNLTSRPRVVVGLSVLPRSVPLHIFFQPGPAEPLRVYHPPDDFIYEFENVRDDTATVPPIGAPIAVLPPHVPAPIVAADFERAVVASL
jgi:hypothetical protein